jgi:hypothetical protein
MLVAVPATPERPRMPAMIATIKKVIAQLNMRHLLRLRISKALIPHDVDLSSFQLHVRRSRCRRIHSAF